MPLPPALAPLASRCSHGPLSWVSRPRSSWPARGPPRPPARSSHGPPALLLACLLCSSPARSSHGLPFCAGLSDEQEGRAEKQACKLAEHAEQKQEKRSRFSEGKGASPVRAQDSVTIASRAGPTPIQRTVRRPNATGTHIGQSGSGSFRGPRGARARGRRTDLGRPRAARFFGCTPAPAAAARQRCGSG